MARYSSWKGYLKISLVSVPVKAYTATSSGASISLNQLHAACNSRIQYKKTCPIHGEVPSDEIVSGYEYTKGQYVVIDTDELEKLRTEKDRSINVNSFVPADKIDPIYQSGKNYYLLPDGPVGQKAYQLIHHAMLDKGVHAVAQVVHSRVRLIGSYAGTIDRFGMFPPTVLYPRGTVGVVDFKTGEIPDWVRLQLVAYAMRTHANPVMARRTRRIGLALRANGKYSVREFPESSWDCDWAKFMQAKRSVDAGHTEHIRNRD
jgi:hypothetical protein